ncbi:hypothetical protein EON64_04200, partial [archaeon]
MIYDANLLLQSRDYRAEFEISTSSGKIFMPQKRGLMFTQGNPLLAESVVAGRGSLDSVQQALSRIQYVFSEHVSSEHNVTDNIRITVLPVSLTPSLIQYNASLADGRIVIDRLLRLPRLSVGDTLLSCTHGERLRIHAALANQLADAAVYNVRIAAKFGTAFVTECSSVAGECLVSGTVEALTPLLANITYLAPEEFSPSQAQDAVNIALTVLGTASPESQASVSVRVVQVNHAPLLSSLRDGSLPRGGVMRLGDFLSVRDSDADDVLSVQLLADSGFVLLLSGRERQLLEKYLANSTAPPALWVPRLC